MTQEVKTIKQINVNIPLMGIELWQPHGPNSNLTGNRTDGVSDVKS